MKNYVLNLFYKTEYITYRLRVITLFELFV